MNIKARIVARKVAFCYIYEHMTLYISEKKGECSFSDFFCEEKEENKEETFASWISSLEDISYVEDRFAYIIEQFFSYPTTPEVDIPYVECICQKSFSFLEEGIAHVNACITSFTFDRMDVIDQTLFILGYTERKVLGTPKEVLINEMVELAKRYGDDGSAKLINGIFHKLIEKKEETKR